jgi:hypothetical protein
MRTSWRFWFLLLLMALLASGIGYGLKSLRGPMSGSGAPARQPSETAAPTDNAATSNNDTELHVVTAAERAAAPQPAAVVHATARPTTTTASSQSRAEPTPMTRQLVSGLANLDFAHGPITAEQAQQWKTTLQTLTAQGAAAVPAIQEFLTLNQEVNFKAVSGGDLLGQSSLRSAFINALAQIGGPEATAAMVQTLQSTTIPSEIAQLAQSLEQQAPGQYRQEAVSAVNEVLNMASNGQLPTGWDVGSLFKVLQNYGDPSTAATLEQLQGPYKYYATMTLAGLPDGQGVPALVQEIQDSTIGGKRDLAFQMLAQFAGQYPDAGSALLQQARANQIPDSAWNKIVTGLAGDQYQMGEPPSINGADPDLTPGLKTYHIGAGNQNFYSLPVAGDATQIQQRIDFINQLLGSTSSPLAINALQGARTTLTGMLQR